MEQACSFLPALEKSFEDNRYKLAIITADQNLTYQNLSLQVDRCCRHLLDCIGNKRKSVIGIYLDASVDFIIAVLAIVKSGHTYLPIERQLPAQSKHIIFQQCKPLAVFSFRDDTAALNRDYTVSGAWRPIESGSDIGLFVPRLEMSIGPSLSDDSLYIMYTSGTTGAPKGVLINGAGVLRLFKPPCYATFAAELRFALLSPISFDASNIELWGALLHGASLVVPDRRLTDPRDIEKIVQDFSVTTLWLTSGLFNLVIDHKCAGLVTLKELLVGGDALSVDHLRLARQYFPYTRLINGYGPSECTTFALCHEITDGDLADGSIPVGRPIAETDALVLLPDGSAAPFDQEGELALMGSGLAAEYLQDPELTFKKFPILTLPDNSIARAYLTGDVAKQRSDGLFEILGRMDDEVKILGKRVRLSEVDELIRSNKNVVNALAMINPIKSINGQRQIAAIVQLKKEGAVSSKTLRQYVSKLSSTEKTPSQIVFAKEIPINKNGKVDRERAKSLFTTPLMRSPRTGNLENDLISIWQECLGFPLVADDNIFDMGADSLICVNAIILIEREFGQPLSMEDLFSAPTIFALASLIKNKGDQLKDSKLIKLQTGGDHVPLVMVHGGGGGIMHFTPLLGVLNVDTPLYALEGDWQSEFLTPPFSIPELAASYIRKINRNIGETQVHLAGLCFGGTIALEMARQLKEQDREVASLTLCDTAYVCGSQSAMRRYLLLYRLGRSWRAARTGKIKDLLKPMGHFERRMIDAVQHYHPGKIDTPLNLLLGDRNIVKDYFYTPTQWAVINSAPTKFFKTRGQRSQMFGPRNIDGTAQALQKIMTADKHSYTVS